MRHTPSRTSSPIFVPAFLHDRLAARLAGPLEASSESADRAVVLGALGLILLTLASASFLVLAARAVREQGVRERSV